MTVPETPANIYADPRKSRLMRRATVAAVSLAAVMVVIKFAAWVRTDSLSMLSSFIDSILDVMASCVNLVAVNYALKPADEDHRFGHGKAENIAGLAQSMFIAGSAVFLVVQSIARLQRPVMLEHEETGIAVTLIALVITMGLVAFQRWVIRQTGSPVVQSDALHYFTDILVGLAVLASYFISMNFSWPLADPLLAVGIAGYILYGAWGIGVSAFHSLMDREFDDAERAKILAIATRHPQVKGMHDLRTRYSGLNAFIQLHLEMDGELLLKDAHAIAFVIQNEIAAAFPNAEVLIHEDVTDDREQDRR